MVARRKVPLSPESRVWNVDGAERYGGAAPRDPRNADEAVGAGPGACPWESVRYFSACLPRTSMACASLEATPTKIPMPMSEYTIVNIFERSLVGERSP